MAQRIGDNGFNALTRAQGSDVHRVNQTNIATVLQAIAGIAPEDILGILGNPYELAYTIIWKDRSREDLVLQCESEDTFVDAASTIARKSIEAARLTLNGGGLNFTDLIARR